MHHGKEEYRYSTAKLLLLFAISRVRVKILSESLN